MHESFHVYMENRLESVGLKCRRRGSTLGRNVTPNGDALQVQSEQSRPCLAQYSLKMHPIL